MPDYSSLVPSIAQSLGVPVPLAMGLFSQESGFDPTKIGSAGEVGMGQIKPSTASQPGYGVPPVDPSQLSDPATNITLSLKYLKAKAAAQGYTNLNDPAQAAAALKSYNGGGDPNYVQNVTARMGPDGASIAAAAGTAPATLPGGTGYRPPVIPDQNIQASPPPPMPDSFGAAPAATAPTAPANVDMSGHQGDPLIALGLGMMGGNGWHDAMAKAGEAYAGASAQAIKAATQNAQFQNDAQNRDADAPQKAAQTAALRAQGWNALNAPNTITADQAMTGNLTQRGQNVTMADAQARAAYMASLSKGQPTTWIVPSDGSKPDQYVTQTHDAAGRMTFNLPDGTTSATPPDGAQPLTSYTHPDPLVASTMKANSKSETDMATQATSARQQNDRFQQSLDALNKPGANVAPGIAGSVGRGIDAALGTSIFGNLTDTQAAQALNQQEILGQFKTAAQGQGGRGSNALRSFIMEAQPHFGQDPAAMKQLIGVLQDNNNMQSAVNDIYNGKDALGVPGLAPADRYQLRRNGSVAQWRDQTFAKLQAARQQAATAASGTAPASPAIGSPSPGSRPPLASFGTQAAPVARDGSDGAVGVDSVAAGAGLPAGTMMRLPDGSVVRKDPTPIPPVFGGT